MSGEIHYEPTNPEIPGDICGRCGGVGVVWDGDYHHKTNPAVKPFPVQCPDCGGKGVKGDGD